MRSLWGVVLVGVVAFGTGCKKASSPAHGPVRSHAEADELWALAPSGITAGIIATPTALALAEAAVGDVRALIAKEPAFAALQAMIDPAITDVFGHDVSTFADIGIDRTKGLATFEADDHQIMLFGLADRAKFVAALHLEDRDPDHLGKATCKALGARLACSQDPRSLDRVGKGSVPALLTALGARGELEGVITRGAVTGAIVVQLDRGQLVLRGTGTVPLPPVAKAIGTHAKPRVDAGTTVGFVALDFGGLPAQLLGTMTEELVPGITGAQLAAALKGPATLTMTAGSIVPDSRVPLADPTPIQSLIDRCGELLPPGLVEAGAEAGACRLKIPGYGASFDLWIDGTTLRIGSKTPIAAKGHVDLTPLGKELATGEWVVSMWGRGTTVGNGTNLAAVYGAMPEGQLLLRVLSLVQEFGGGVKLDGNTISVVVGLRTLWANPPALVAKVLAIPLDDAMKSDSAAVKSVVASAPGSLFAGDVTSGQAGLMVPMMGIGMLSAVAIPAFLDYGKRSRATAAEIQLNRLAKQAKREYAEVAAFPVGETPVTPVAACCDQVDNKCHPTAVDWADPTWTSLDFSVDEPTPYQFKYKGTGTSFQAFAIGDLDCDGTPAIWTLDGSIDPATGNPVTTITKPPPGEY